MNELERSLLRRLRERDERAFRELVPEHRDRVYNICYRMLGNRPEAEDVAQEVFIAVFKTIDSFREESKFSTWLYRVSVNHCKNRIISTACPSTSTRVAWDRFLKFSTGSIRTALAAVSRKPGRRPSRCARWSKILASAAHMRILRSLTPTTPQN